MVIDLKEAKFDNDFIRIALPKGGQLVINCIDEGLGINKGKVAEINKLSLQIQDTEKYKGYFIDCSCIIGFTDILTRITTEYKEYEGKVINKDNMRFCKVEVYE